jgi:hypothetical protein
MKKPTPEDRERRRRIDEQGKAARENMQRILDEIDARRRDREQHAQRSLWSRLRAGLRPHPS